MATDLPAKLRVTAAALGCSSRKDLCARFRTVNPATHFDLERSHKWMQGRAEPRSSLVYEDWARLLGTARPAAWVATCKLPAFIDEVARLLDADVAKLRHAAAAGMPGGQGVAQPRHPSELRGQVGGAYACYSLAWSPYFQGQWVRGGLVLEPGRGRDLAATYSELLGGAQVRFQGSASLTSRTLNVLLRDGAGEFPLFLCLYLPSAPANALCGVLAGSTVLAQDSRPTAGRFAAIRVPEGAPLDATNRYFEPAPGAVAADLLALGVPPDGCPDIEAAVRALLVAGGIEQVPASAQVRLAEAADRAHFGSVPARPLASS